MRITENLGRGALGHDSAVLQHHAGVGHVFHDVELMGGQNHGLGAASPADQRFDELALAPRIQGDQPDSIAANVQGVLGDQRVGAWRPAAQGIDPFKLQARRVVTAASMSSLLALL